MTDANRELKEKCLKAIDTTMIGSLSAIEYEMEEDLKDPIFRDIFMKIRSRILEQGNNQKKKVERIFNNYEVESKVNHYQLPFRGNQ